MHSSLDTLLYDVRQALEVMYGDQFVGLVLYGSQARGEASTESDIDLLVLLRGPFDLFAEIKRLTILQLDLLDKYHVVCSFQPFSEAEYRQRQSPFLINVRKEGVPI